jgi:hypothetical protein
MVDFVQCCQDLSFDWGCVFPAETPAEEAAAPPRKTAHPPLPPPPRRTGGGGACFVAEHSLLLSGAPPRTAALRGDSARFWQPRRRDADGAHTVPPARPPAAAARGASRAPR